MPVQRLWRAIVRYGVGGALRAASARLWGRVFLFEHHVWYALDVAAQRPRRELEERLTLRRGGESDLDLLARLPTVSTDQARLRLARRNALWLVLDGEQLLFACWIFHGETPVIAAPGREMRLGDDTGVWRTVSRQPRRAGAESPRGRGRRSLTDWRGTAYASSSPKSRGRTSLPVRLSRRSASSRWRWCTF